ncbi:MAG TPA: BTAD domain-containing putative transcriptional regulator, partial [Actinocrinis sp.]|nr:BTAD domain-containing putative transcriptional regulator [Actinocrinis sp.]
LGPVTVAPRTPTAAKVRVVLAVLLVRANETVSTESLIDELWDNSPPRTAGTTLQVYISQLRRILLEGDPAAGAHGRQLLTLPPGYCLQVAQDDLDLTRFEALHRAGKAAYERGDFATASSLLQEALGLWSGVALSGIPHGYTLSAAAVRLEELRMTALEQRLTADLRLGRHKELTGELMALTSEHPLRETLHAHLMVALFRSDRQSDALKTFARIRRSLVDELGIEPGPGLRHLHERVLRSDPNLLWREPAAVAAPLVAPVVWLPPSLPDFVGREEAIATALRAFPDRTGRAAAPILVLGGRAGVGKTTLAVELARRAADVFPHGRIFVQLRGPQGMALEPGEVIAHVLHRLDQAATADGTAPATPPDASASASTSATSADAVPSSEPAADRLQRLTRGRRMLLILDDVATEEQVRPLLAAVPGVFVLMTTRRTLAGLDGARHLVLDVLKPREAQQLLEEIAGSRITDDPESALEIARLCGYLPLGLRVAGAGLAARPHWTAAALAQRLDGEGAGLAELVAGDLDVRASLLVGYREADPAHQWAFRLLALAPVPSFALWSAAALLNDTLPRTERIVDQLLQSYLLEVRQSAREYPLRYGYHRLLRALALELLGGDDPITVTAAIERLCTACLAVARHADAMLTPGRVPYEARYGTVVSESFDKVAQLVGATPVHWFQEEGPGLVDAVRRAHTAGLWPLTWQLAECLSGYFDARAAWPEWSETHSLALDAARRERDALAEAAVLRSLGDLAWQQQRVRQAAMHYEDARTLFLAARDHGGAARCLIGLGDVQLSEGDPRSAAKTYADALGQCAQIGDERGRADALRGLAVVELQCGHAEESLQTFAAFAEVAEQLGDRRWIQFAHRTRAWILERAVDWSDPREQWAPQAVEARPGIWVVGSFDG